MPAAPRFISSSDLCPKLQTCMSNCLITIVTRMMYTHRRFTTAIMQADSTPSHSIFLNKQHCQPLNYLGQNPSSSLILLFPSLWNILSPHIIQHQPFLINSMAMAPIQATITFPLARVLLLVQMIQSDLMLKHK